MHSIAKSQESSSNFTQESCTDNVRPFPVQRGNWVAVSRTLLDHPYLGPGQKVRGIADPKTGAYSRLEAWLYLIGKATWRPMQVMNKGTQITLERGQVMAPIHDLGRQWNWTEKSVRGFLNKLVKLGACHIYAPRKPGKQKGNLVQVITLCNYDKYQSAGEPKGQAKGRASGPQRASQGREYNKETTEQDTSPPYPPQTGGEKEDLNARSEGKEARADTEREPSRPVQHATPHETKGPRARRPRRKSGERKRHGRQEYVQREDGRTWFGFDHPGYPPIAYKRLNYEQLNDLLEAARAIWPAVEPDDVRKALTKISGSYSKAIEAKQDVPIGRIIADAAEEAATAVAYRRHDKPETLAGGKAATRRTGYHWPSSYSTLFCVLTEEFLKNTETRWPDAWRPRSDEERKDIELAHYREFCGITSAFGSTGYGQTLQGEVEKRFEQYLAELDERNKAELKPQPEANDASAAEEKANVQAKAAAFEAQVERVLREANWSAIERDDWREHERSKSEFGAQAFHEAMKRRGAPAGA